MIYIIYTTQTTHKQYKFDLNFGVMKFESQMRRSSIARDIIGYGNNSVSLDKFITAGLDIKFEGESSFEKALIKILPCEKSIRDISDVYHYLDGLKGTTRMVVETKLLAEKYKDIYELYDDIREMGKKSAKSMVSLYTPMIGIYNPFHTYLRDPVPENVVYENIEQIESSIQNAYCFRIIHCHTQGNVNSNIVTAEFHADVVNKSPFLRLDIYFNRTFTQQEFKQFRDEHFYYIRFNSVDVKLPEYHYDVSIEACDPVFTTEEINQKYFNK